jgi:isoleucyl-tRNA synthetase
VHLQTFPVIPAAWKDEALAAKWATLRDVRRVVTGALEVERRAKTIGSSLESSPILYGQLALLAAFDGLDAAEICITSGLRLMVADVPDTAFTLADVPGVGVVFQKADGEKCQRCWKVLPDVGSQTVAGVCGRCADVVSNGE